MKIKSLFFIVRWGGVWVTAAKMLRGRIDPLSVESFKYFILFIKLINLLDYLLFYYFVGGSGVTNRKNPRKRTENVPFELNANF